jgi:TatA/E family protein of Tat protein translocase
VPNLGASELIVIFLILLLVFGASRLPALGEGLGRTIRGFKKGISDDPAPVAKSEAQVDSDEPAKPTVNKTEADDAELVDKS